MTMENLLKLSQRGKNQTTEPGLVYICFLLFEEITFSGLNEMSITVVGIFGHSWWCCFCNAWEVWLY